MNFDLGLGAGLDQPSFFEVSAHERVVPTLHSAFEHAITVRPCTPGVFASSARGSPPSSSAPRPSAARAPSVAPNPAGASPLRPSGVFELRARGPPCRGGFCPFSDDGRCPAGNGLAASEAAAADAQVPRRGVFPADAARGAAVSAHVPGEHGGAPLQFDSRRPWHGCHTAPAAPVARPPRPPPVRPAQDGAAVRVAAARRRRARAAPTRQRRRGQRLSVSRRSAAMGAPEQLTAPHGTGEQRAVPGDRAAAGIAGMALRCHAFLSVDPCLLRICRSGTTNSLPLWANKIL